MATAAIVTVAETGGSVRKIAWTVTSSDTGTASLVTSRYYDGKIITLVTNPGATAPTDNWDLTVLDSDSEDVLVGAGIDRDTANTELVGEASLGAVANSKLTLSIANAGAEKTGVTYLYIR